MSLPASARDSAVSVACIDPCMRGNDRGVLLPLPSGVQREVNDIGLLENMRGSRFDPVTSLIAYSNSSEVD